LDRRIDRILSSGPHGYLKKPYTLNELAAEIAKTIGSRNPRNDFLPAEMS